MRKSIELVREFHETFGQPVRDEPSLGDEALNALRISLLEEETRELKEALERRDAVEVLDALTDLQYVLDGAYLALGFHRVKEAALAEVHRSNMTKLDDDGKPVLREGDGKILKGPHFDPPDLRSVLDLEFDRAAVHARERAAFEAKHGTTPEAWLEAWRKGVLRDDLENNMSLGEALVLVDHAYEQEWWKTALSTYQLLDELAYRMITKQNSLKGREIGYLCEAAIMDLSKLSKDFIDRHLSISCVWRASVMTSDLLGEVAVRMRMVENHKLASLCEEALSKLAKGVLSSRGDVRSGRSSYTGKETSEAKPSESSESRMTGRKII